MATKEPFAPISDKFLNQFETTPNLKKKAFTSYSFFHNAKRNKNLISIDYGYTSFNHHVYIYSLKKKGLPILHNKLNIIVVFVNQMICILYKRIITILSFAILGRLLVWHCLCQCGTQTRMQFLVNADFQALFLPCINKFWECKLKHWMYS